MRKIFKHYVNGTRIKAEREGAFSYARGGRAPQLWKFQAQTILRNPKC
jgi:predicted metalloprotease with PDZ domain